MTEQTGSHRSPNYGGRLGHAIFHAWIRWLGVRPAYVLLMLIIPYYVIFRGRARRSVAPYLNHRFPHLSRFRRLLKTIMYFYSFGQSLIDRAAMGILGPKHFTVEFPGSDELHRLAQEGRGLILLTTHIGNWQTSMASMGALETPVYFQFQLEAHTAGRHFFDLAGQHDRFRFISPQGFLGGMVEITNALRSGECVAVMGDRAWGGKTRTTSFLGEPAAFPITPYHLALVTGAELVVLLTVRTGKCAYRLEYTQLTKDYDRVATSREEAIRELLRRYVRCLEACLAEHPLMWFNFFDFWSPDKENA